jgi:hypothetical protein
MKETSLNNKGVFPFIIHCDFNLIQQDRNSYLNGNPI